MAWHGIPHDAIPRNTMPFRAQHPMPHHAMPQEVGSIAKAAKAAAKLHRDLQCACRRRKGVSLAWLECPIAIVVIGWRRGVGFKAVVFKDWGNWILQDPIFWTVMTVGHFYVDHALGTCPTPVMPGFLGFF